MRLLVVAILYLYLQCNSVSLHPQSSSLDLARDESRKALYQAIRTGNVNDFQRLLMGGVNLNAADQNGDTALMVAAKKGSEKMVKQLIENGADVNALNRMNNSALILALTYGFEKVAELLIRNSADVNYVGSHGDTSIIWAAEKGFERTVRMLIERGANVNAVNSGHNSALIYAAVNGHESIVRLLIENGADLNVINTYKNSALISAIIEGYDKVAELLIQRGANVNIPGNHGNSALALAAEKGFERIVEMLIEKGANVNIRTQHGNTALIRAAEKGFGQIVRKLIERGADLNAENDDHNSAIICAALEGHQSIVRLLVESGANINAVNTQNNTALISAIKLGYENVVRILIEKGANVNARDKNGDSPLHLAIRSSERESIARLLIENGADLNAVDKKYRVTPLEVAIGRANAMGVELLIQSGAKISAGAITLAASRGNREIVQTFIENGANLDARDFKGNSALILAAANGDVNMMKLLIDNGANLHINTVNNNGQTALIKAMDINLESAAKTLIENTTDSNVNAVGEVGGEKAVQFLIENSINATKFLIENGADPNVGRQINDSVLLFAISKEYHEIAKLLIQKRADINAVGDEGFTPLLRSAHLRNVMIVRILIENGVYNINHQGTDGRTALMIAAGSAPPKCICNGSEEILQQLINKGAHVNAIDSNGRTALDAAFDAKKEHDRKEVIRILMANGAERGATLLYRNTAVNACGLYSSLTAHWNQATGGRVLEGTKAKFGEFPWMVALGYLNHGSYTVSFSCGGSLISDTFVLTAAHCVKESNRPVVARLGQISLANGTGFRAESQNIRDIFSHREYSSSTKKNDIALIQLLEHLYITKLVQPICIQTLLQDEHPQTNLIVTGWGQTDRMSKPSNDLLKTDLKTMPLADCNEIFLNYNKERQLKEFQNGIDDSQYCAHDPNGRADSCQGDSGGPLQINQTYLEPVKVVGVVSIGISCGAGLPGIYTRVAHYIEWIGSHVWPNGEIRKPQVYIKEDDNVDDVSTYTNDTALILAILRQDNVTALSLIRNGIDINTAGDDGFTPLMRSAIIGDEEIARALIKKGANVNATNDIGDSVLIAAAMNYRVEIFRILIENGADMNRKGANDKTPLIILSSQVDLHCPLFDCQGYKAIVQLIINRGANVNAVDKDGRTALDAALEATESEDREDVIRLLTQRAAERGATSLYRQTAERACRIYSGLADILDAGGIWIMDGPQTEGAEFPWMVALGYLSSQYKVEFLCSGSLISDTFVLTAAHCVKASNRPVVARLGKANIGNEDDFQTENQNIREIIVHPNYLRSTKKNDIALIRLSDRLTITKFIRPICLQTLMKDERIETNLTVTRWGRTSSSRSSTHLFKNIVKTMPLAECNEIFSNYNKERQLRELQNEIDESQYCAHDPMGRTDSCEGDSGGPLQTPQTYSGSVKVVGVVSFGLKCGNGLPGIYTRVAHYIEWIGAHVWPNGEISTPRIYEDDIYDDANDTSLNQAISRGYDSKARRLIEEGADVNAVGVDGLTPLMKSAQLGNDEIARVLIEKGANINVINGFGETALNLAALGNHVNISKWLIEKGADINHKDAFDETPLIIAADQGYKEVLRLLIDKGANINIVDRNGRTALDAAIEDDEIAVVNASIDSPKDRDEVIRLLMENGAEHGATLLYRKTASRACRLYSNLTGRWNYLIARGVSNGSLIEIGQFPWMVALGYLSSHHKVSFACGGSLISDTFVLTAAHCVSDNRQPVVVRLGKVTLTAEEGFRTENQNIREIIAHPKYSASPRKNDIALIRLIDHISFTKSVQPVCIQTLLRDENIETDLIATGWRQVNEDHTSIELLKVRLKTMPLAECNETVSNDNKNRDLTQFQKGIDESQYCAYDPNGTKDSCPSHIGGPLQTPQTQLGPIKVVGVVSIGISCGAGLPGIYTRVAHHIEWIGAYVWPNGEIYTPHVSIADIENNDNDRLIFRSK